MYFILQGVVEVKYMQDRHSLLYFREGSYFGDVSFIFKVKNKYSYTPREKSAVSIFSIKEEYLDDFFEDYADFREMMKIRALRRHRYIRKLKD